MIRFRPSCLLSLAVIVVYVSNLIAAPPKVTGFYPPGASRGASIVVTAAGDFPNWPAKARCDQPGVKLEAEKDKGKFNATISADSIPGVSWIRVYGDDGPASPKPFVIGVAPELDDTEPN